jgi:hypothetical protein
MRWLAHVPGRPKLLSLFRAARTRLMKEDGKGAALTDERLVSATTEINQIADDIHEAEADVAVDADAVAGQEAARPAPEANYIPAEFEITITLESNSAGAVDPVFVRRVFARDELAALIETTRLVRAERPELDSQKLWAWSFRRIDSAEALTVGDPSVPAKSTVVAK